MCYLNGKMRSGLVVLEAVLLLFLANSCTKGGFTEVYDLPGSKWPTDWAINFEFSLSDSLSYNNIDLIIRHKNLQKGVNMLEKLLLIGLIH